MSRQNPCCTRGVLKYYLLISHSLSVCSFLYLLSPGILHVSAVDLCDTSTSSHITISNNVSRLSTGEIQQMLLNSQLFEEEDKQHQLLLCSIQSLQAYISVVRNTCTGTSGASSILTEEEKTFLMGELDKAESWLQIQKNRKNQQEETTDTAEGPSTLEATLTSTTCAARERELERVCQPLLKKIFALDMSSAATLDTADKTNITQPTFNESLTAALEKLQLQQQEKARTEIDQVGE